jgi:hypothetical protein
MSTNASGKSIMGVWVKVAVEVVRSNEVNAALEV